MSLLIAGHFASAARPWALNANYAAGDSTHAILTRATAARRINNSGLWETVSSGTLRYHHTVATAPLGILLEEAQQDLAGFSEDVEAWGSFTGDMVATNNAGTSPTGLTDAGRLAFGIQFSRAGQFITTIDSTTYTMSFWARRESGNTSLWCLHVNSASGDNTPFTITDSWAHYEISFLGRTGGGFVECGIQDRNAGGQGSILVWGVNVVEGALATTPIEATTGNPTDRNADVLVADVTGADLSEGSIVIDARMGRTNGTLWRIDDGSDDNLLRIYRHSDDSIRFEIVAGTTQQAEVVGAAIGNLTEFLVAVSWKTNAFRLAIDGEAMTAVESGSVPSGLTTERLGADIGAGFWNATIASLKRGGVARKDGDLALLTSGQFDIFALFGGGEGGGVYQIGATETLYRDSTLDAHPVVGQAVGALLSLLHAGAESTANGDALQATESQRPTLSQDADGHLYLSHDGNDALTVTFGASLGSNCTVVYVTPIGVTVLEGQTISTSFTLPQEDLYFCFVIDRALTATEWGVLNGWA